MVLRSSAFAMTSELTSTATLVRRYRDGDLAARDDLVERYLPVFRRWAHGRLPRYARGTAETDDLVQRTLLRALQNLDSFEVRHEGAFVAYLRRIFLNQVRDEIRRAGRSPRSVEVPPETRDRRPSPVEEVLGRQELERYEAALAELPSEHREAILLRMEFGMTFEEIARALGRPSANATRMMVSRALERLAESLDG